MDWRLKCLALHALGVPGTDVIHRWLQKHVTKRYFFTVPSALSVFGIHADNYRKLSRPARALEFGAGPNLLAALLLSNAGAEVWAFDLHRIARADRVNHIIRQLSAKVPGNWPEIRDFEDLERLYRIHYVAPGDARATGLPDGSIDFFYSTSVMEHIPEHDLVAILRECKRLASRDALMSFSIGYWDHYAGVDRSITRMNFFRYNDPVWRLFNPARQYQNRLRHGDFERLFEELGFDTLSNERVRGDERELDVVPLAKRFRRYSRDDLLTVSGRFLLSPHDSAAPR
jgi:Methyltransferase domain